MLADEDPLVLPRELLDAAKFGEVMAIATWLDSGGSVDAWRELTPVSVTMLMMACEHGQEQAVKLLLERGASVDLTSSDGGTALMFASGRGHERVVRCLLGWNAAFDVQNHQGLTALMSACFYDHVSIVRRLLTAGAATELRAVSGQTALQCAERGGSTECVAAIKEHERGRKGPPPTLLPAPGMKHGLALPRRHNPTVCL